MADTEVDSGLFAIQLSDAEDSAAQDAKNKKSADRTGQTEEEFQKVKSTYRVKVENGELWKHITLPSPNEPVSKPQAQALLHAVEELYFLKRYAEGAELARKILGGRKVAPPTTSTSISTTGNNNKAEGSSDVGDQCPSNTTEGGEDTVTTTKKMEKVHHNGNGKESKLGLDDEVAKILRYYEGRCEEKQRCIES